MDSKSSYYGSEIKCEEVSNTFPPQHQTRQPGFEYLMIPRPVYDNPHYIGTGKLNNKVAIISGGDSGIGRAVAVAFAKEGADIVIAYFDEHEDARETKQAIEHLGQRCLLIPGDLRNKNHCQYVIACTLETFGKIDVLVNNLAVQFVQNRFLDISDEQWHTTFDTNLHPFFYMTKAALPYMTEGSSIINTASINVYTGRKDLIDYTATKGAIVSFTRALANNIVDQGIRVNAVAPGPIWTPLIPASFSPDMVKTFGNNVPMKRAGQPYELAPVYVLLASSDGSYITGQTIHVNGGGFVAS
ncbi:MULTISPECIES: SDR family oxidoreductase [Heyndrickxia]|jgi:NAD(P)-dependent dehydrogenase (short-subunit alcohol dehydrogenase family)|uniref:SDR family oxidoreductase n=1 Tax=Heyndrickxia TaxID=2837504 RepID=UPI000779A315|nr:MULTISPECIES: SDR family oxidoreductase [Heyndrickxia]KYC71490.1 3-oxoacyl-[acyl-carrier protein] reductase [Heyndrickxia coagulans]MBF8416950.1 SDR family oxidoreductase [Heyndrickxia coagulans]MED4321111.1 SDR family oxidoreductase [Weizmannia sp. CD-2023]MED4977522.1 SDR family oxidoreductase [Weizmannia sp. CD-2023]UXC22219.1 SDR family oxidoreductase [Heyndrickxia coagulans]